jgi:Rad3-related DNA helicase
MARRVAEVLQEEGFLLAEAGTGIGKSLAYLVPAALWSRRELAPVVISTNTRNLQAQLMEKDLPLLMQALPFPFEAALLKGRGNYPCVRTLVSACTDAAGSLFRSERLAAAFLISWLVQTPGGDLEELESAAFDEMEALPTLLGRVRSQGDACAGALCSYKDCCPVDLARARAREADLIVVNHALMLAESKSPVLPEYSRLVVDEAHNLEAVATDALALEFSSAGAAQLLRALVGGPGNLADLLRRRLADMPHDPLHELVARLLEGLAQKVEALHHATDAMGGLLYDFTFDHNEGRGEADRATLRLTDAVRETEEWAEVAQAGVAALSDGLALHTVMVELTRSLKELCKGARPGVEGLDADAEAVRLRVSTSMEALATILQPENTQGYVTWSEAWRTRGVESWCLRAAPIDVSRVLDEALLAHKDAMVFTSATLTVDGAFSYYRQRTGLNQHADKLAEMMAPSPFDLTEQLLLCVPSDMPDPSQAGYNEAVVEALGQICEVTGGGTLALFTARSRMQQAFAALKDKLADEGMTPLCQDLSGPRWELLERLKADPTAVLFGLKSFWEGVDVPGDALRCVVIAKLPFGVPSDPIIQARQEHARTQGLNPMEDYYLPEAILAFKQGFGRLIRTVTDTGVVFVLDRRIITRGYGRRFFRSIQRCELSRESLAQCLAQAAGWLGRR